MIQLGVDDSKFKKGMNSATATIKKFAGAIGLAYGTRELLRFTAETVKLAAKVEGIKTAFDQLNTPGLLENLRKATRNTVADVDLMSAAVRANNFRISLEALPKYFQFAQQRARATGESVDYLVESIVMGIGRKSAMILDNLGISLAEINEELKRTPDYATAVGNIMDRYLDKSGETAMTSADQIAQLGAAWKNLGAEIGKIVNETLKLGNALQSVAEVLSGITDLNKQLDLGGANKDLANQVRGNISMASGTTGGYFMSMLFGGRKAGKNEILIAGADPIVRKAEQQKEAIEDTTDAIKEYNRTIMDAEQLWNSLVLPTETGQQLGGTWGALSNSFADPSKLAEISSSVSTVTQDMTGLWVITDQIAGTFGDMFSAGIMGWDEFGKAAIRAIQNMLVQLAALAATYAVLSMIPGFSGFMETVGGFSGFMRRGMGLGTAPAAISNVTALGSAPMELRTDISGDKLAVIVSRGGVKHGGNT